MSQKPTPVVFLISQPRAGSTLLQRMLSGHPAIHTTAEPWIQLLPLYAIREAGWEAEFDAAPARVALRDFLGTLPNGEQTFYEAVRAYSQRLYSEAISTAGKQIFLDKTPRYYEIIPQLAQVYPDSKYILLSRNPLAVLASIVDAWVHPSWLSLHVYRHDLLRAPALLCDALDRLGDAAIFVQYEELVRSPEPVMRSLCSKLGIGYLPSMLDYGKRSPPDGRLGDKKVNTKGRPEVGSIARWKELLLDPQFWRCASEYLEALDPAVIDRFGFDKTALRAELSRNRPRSLRRYGTLSLNYLLGRPRTERGRLARRLARTSPLLRKRAAQ